MRNVTEELLGIAYSAWANAKIGDPTDTRERLRFALAAVLQREAAGDGEKLAPSCPAIDADKPTDPDHKRLAALADWIEVLAPGRSLSARTYLMELSRKLYTAPRPTGTDEIDPNSASFREGFSVGRAESEFMCGLLKDPKCHSCGARNAKEAESMCRPDGDSCPGTEWPLSNIWALTTPASAEPGEEELPDEGAYLIQYDDADQSPELFAGCGAKDAAMHRYAQISNNWNAHLFVKIASNSRDCETPNATFTPEARGGGEAEPVAWRYLKPLGGAFVWTRWMEMEDLVHYGGDGSIVKGPHPDWKKVEYAYRHPTPAALDAERLDWLSQSHNIKNETVLNGYGNLRDRIDAARATTGASE
jgi:hypothetical protein